MVRIWQGTLDWWRLYQLSKTKLPHNPLLRHLLHEDIEDDLRFCHPILSVTCAEIRNTSGVSSLNELVRVRLPDHRSVHIKLLVRSNVALLRLLSSKVSLRTTQVIFIHGRNSKFVDVLNYNKIRTLLRVYTVATVGMSMCSPSKISHNGKASSGMAGRPIENLSHDQSCRNRGHPRMADLAECSMQALHIARYVATKTAEPQLLCLICAGSVTSAISRAKGR